MNKDSQSKIYSTSRSSPNQQRSAETVRKILSATSALLASDGLESITTNAIAKQLYMPVGSIYKYYKTKDDILFALCDLYAAEFIRLINQKGSPLSLATHEPSDYASQLCDDLSVWAAQNDVLHSLFNTAILSGVSCHAAALRRDILAALKTKMESFKTMGDSSLRPEHINALYCYLSACMSVYLHDSNDPTYQVMANNLSEFVFIMYNA